MIQLSLNSSNEDILQAVINWIEVLAEEKYSEAWQMLWHPSEDDHWSKELMVLSIESYGVPDDPTLEKYRVTSYNGIVPRHDVTRINKGVHSPFAGSQYVAIVDVDVPLNGEISDLTATVQVFEVEASLVLKLHDIHVQ